MTVPELAVKVSEFVQVPATLMLLFSPLLVSRVPPVIVKVPLTSRASSSSKVAVPPPSLKVTLLNASPSEKISSVPEAASKVTVPEEENDPLVASQVPETVTALLPMVNVPLISMSSTVTAPPGAKVLVVRTNNSLPSATVSAPAETLYMFDISASLATAAVDKFELVNDPALS